MPEFVWRQNPLPSARLLADMIVSVKSDDKLAVEISSDGSRPRTTDSAPNLV